MRLIKIGVLKEEDISGKVARPLSYFFRSWRLISISCGRVHVERCGSCYSYYLCLHGDLPPTFCQYRSKPLESLESLQQEQLGVESSNAGWVERPGRGNGLSASMAHQQCIHQRHWWESGWSMHHASETCSSLGATLDQAWTSTTSFTERLGHTTTDGGISNGLMVGK